MIKYIDYKRSHMNVKGKSLLTALVSIILVALLVNGNSVVFGADNSNQISSSGDAPEDIVLYTAQIYAKHFGVSVDEALHRLKLQDSFPGLQRALVTLPQS
jgi:3-dehydroquinate synthase class II